MGLFDKFKNVFAKSNSEDIKAYDKGLSKTRKTFFDKLNVLNSKYKILDSEYFDELENILIMADIGVNTVMDFIDRLKCRVKKEGITDASLLTEIIIDELFIIYVDEDVISSKLNLNNEGPTVVLFVGVNGVGKLLLLLK